MVGKNVNIPLLILGLILLILSAFLVSAALPYGVPGERPGDIFGVIAAIAFLVIASWLIARAIIR